MKKRFLGLIALGLFGAVAFGAIHNNTVQVKAESVPEAVLFEGEEPETEDEGGEETTPACTVVIGEFTHGTVKVDKMSGEVGEIVTINADANFLYIIDYVRVNETDLIESEDTTGLFTFALVEGENKITASFVIDEELCGDLAGIIEDAENHDWASLFTLENVIVLVKWVLDGGVLLAMARYYIKDKKLEKKVETKIQETINEIIPETTKNTVIECVSKVVAPSIETLGADMAEIMRAMSVFSKCMALAQENTPDSRRAILDELTGLKIGDKETLAEMKKYIEELVARNEQSYRETIAAIESIQKSSKETIEQVNSTEETVEVPATESKDNGTQI